MKISVEKSLFLRLAYQVHAGGAVDHDCLDAAEAEARCLHGELEAS